MHDSLPCHILAIQVDKRGLRDSGESIKDDTELYQFAFIASSIKSINT